MHRSLENLLPEMQRVRRCLVPTGIGIQNTQEAIAELLPDGIGKVSSQSQTACPALLPGFKHGPVANLDVGKDRHWDNRGTDHIRIARRMPFVFSQCMSVSAQNDSRAQLFYSVEL